MHDLLGTHSHLTLQCAEAQPACVAVRQAQPATVQCDKTQPASANLNQGNKSDKLLGQLQSAAKYSLSLKNRME
jgi:hypothetical protein